MKGGNGVSAANEVTLLDNTFTFILPHSPFDCKRAFKILGHEIMKLKKNAETADYSQNTQTGWECGDNANYVVYATIPARFLNILILKIIFQILTFFIINYLLGSLCL